MTGYMFRSKLGAVVFVGLILFSVYRMVGTESDGGELVDAVETIEAGRQSGPPRQQSASAYETGGELTFEEWAREPEPTAGKPLR